MVKLWKAEPDNQAKPTISFDILEQQYWLPGEHMRGSVVVKVPCSATISNARIDLEGARSRMKYNSNSAHEHAATGLSLIHIINKDRSTRFSAYKFLSQNHDVRSIHKVNDETRKSGFSTYRIPFDFMVSRTISTNADKSPTKSLELPPTMLIGTAIWSYDHRRVFAQPNISYHLVAKVVLFDQSTSNTWILREERPVKIWKTSSIMPPISLDDFAAEYTTVAETQCALRPLDSPKLRFRVSTTEPAAIAFSCRKSAQTAKVYLSARLSRPTSYMDERRFRRLLAKIKIQVQPSLRGKTFYSPVTFEKIPGQTMLTPMSNCRMNDEEVLLDAVMGLPVNPAAAEEKDETDQDHQNMEPDAHTHAPKLDAVWHGHFCCSLTIPHGLVPTFWSTTASQQYSLLLDVKVSGIKLQGKLRLEVPLQIFYDLGPIATPCGPLCRRLRNEQTGRPLRDWEEREVCTTIVMRDVDEGNPPIYV
ncbi:uncharacterized protein Z519_02577 [Cladophialophora bantiana CBS 173.52]|uniref:Arrestin-like N-terminal domain-containing protein n=1 Tax=Cladophialophora bantiana (strain ATCC 10958 / CBS 173.52 / CDC B-1940 / NIH 8579) TaxID=1442370 RepID=A0A0D2I1Y6_CLAB1|nr:uncharacterized protein Z519_02577 [Cladophialophora bantiana CBS 173.52]KIW97185.1 hypothetical protein Z519_02577 [Cladophialophora bantiana CBS 173.52]